ncbi:2-C-methyl-D-erythritol 4-phosphate cytidylyltransferase [Parahaliea maris]|uniref:2-C-methyl-D-erythritol 4-phosphate cytidylyltransferase n=2 Tax=Parahaliea maris TaxID=2716870 RepID=A0A5C9A577_9GAMM|nr:2-C-methyl-D-erythritol 4-phosphate cytidylyltransferase [Parahaliea maris]
MGSDLPKQYLPLAGEPLLSHSLRALLDCPGMQRVVVALHPDDGYADSVAALSDERVVRAAGGAERADSVLAGLEALQQIAYDDDWVLVHDAARPGLARADLARLIAGVGDQPGGGILALPVVDTLKRAGANDLVEATVDRARYWRAQTPQMFRLGALREALRGALAAGVTVTDEASAMEWAGHPVQLVEGSPGNLKVTVAADLALAGFYLASSTQEKQ